MSNRFTTPGYKDLKFEFNLMFDSYDKWGIAMEWWFALAELLYHEMELPASVEFHDSPMHLHGYEPEGHTENMLDELYDAGTVTVDDLKTLLEVITRWAGLLKAAGLDY